MRSQSTTDQMGLQPMRALLTLALKYHPDIKVNMVDLTPPSCGWPCLGHLYQLRDLLPPLPATRTCSRSSSIHFSKAAKFHPRQRGIYGLPHLDTDTKCNLFFSSPGHPRLFNRGQHFLRFLATFRRRHGHQIAELKDSRFSIGMLLPRGA